MTDVLVEVTDLAVHFPIRSGALVDEISKVMSDLG